MTEFTPVSAAIGGALIGLSAVLLMALNGRIAGISGLFSGTFFSETGDRAWRGFFLIGLVAAPVIYTLFQGEPPTFEMTSSLPMIIVAGLLVGFGTRLGSGCTSGHGVCGMSRLSLRSMAAVALFMASGAITVALAKFAVGG
ncbi:MAG TPA: YeeE/YedE family protein [Hyphomonas sp.]|nr:YeeE/YedE family protein [Hyphomonas sp.]HRK66009.1 YeeE/YedE family protein [Hyphomonas sp.]